MRTPLFLKILRAYPSWVTRAYLVVRFSIIRRILVDLLENLPERGTVLNLGSGIGLFDIYAAHHRPGVEFIGVDVNPKRIALSSQAARTFGVSNVTFIHGDVTEALPDLAPDVVITLDVLHHIPTVAQDRLLEWVASHLRPDGVLFVKDISTRTPWKVTFTRVLDDIMTRRQPTYYFSAGSMRERLARLGFVTTTFHLWDYIPFPHIIYVAHKGRAANAAAAAQGLK
jgi:cyclopropane fatty-acyl-phospholipid synthase-like methyltransferase